MFYAYGELLFEAVGINPPRPAFRTNVGPRHIEGI